MKTWLAAIAFAFSAPLAAHAANVSCDGSYLFYKFHITAKYKGTQLTSKIKVVITNGSNVKTVMLTPTASQILENQSLFAKGSGDDASGEQNASYKGNATYKGTLYARTSSGSASVPVTCKLGSHFSGAVEYLY